MIHSNKVAIAVVAATFIAIGSRYKENDKPIKENTLAATKLTSPKLIERLEKQIYELSMSLDRLWCRTAGIGKTGGFCLTEQNINVGSNTQWDVQLCQALEVLFGYNSVLDFGAGLGHYGKCFLRKSESIFITKQKKQTEILNNNFLKQMGDLIKEPQHIRSWDGYDGAINVEFLSRGFIKQQDLSIDNLWLGRTWDWVLSLEVGEHIPVNYEDNFIKNLVRHGCRGLVISWALENQGGHHHVNGRNNDYIKQKMADNGLINDVKAEEQIREKAVLPYFKRTLMVFRYSDNYKCTNTLTFQDE